MSASSSTGSYWHRFEVPTVRSTTWRRRRPLRPPGVRLVHIFEWEWDENRPLFESKIRSILRLPAPEPGRIYARKCVLDPEVSPKEKARFLSENHFQRFGPARRPLSVYGLRDPSTRAASSP